MKKQLHIIKIGGNCIDDEDVLQQFLNSFSSLPGYKILIHGGGSIANKLADSLGIEQTFIQGRRITNQQTLDIAIMSYRGLINASLVARLQSLGCNTIGLCGADAGSIKAKKRAIDSIDFGYVGDINPDSFNTDFLQSLLEQSLCPVLSPITFEPNGSLLNTNADTIATMLAIAMNSLYDISLMYCFDKEGVMSDMHNQNSRLETLSESEYISMRNAGAIQGGMHPKLENAFLALRSGIKSIILTHPSALQADITRIVGTRII